MNLPEDWNEDQKLWDLLGRLPGNRPPSNFSYMVRRKVTGHDGIPRRPVSAWSLFRRWAPSAAAAGACLALVFVFIRPQPKASPETQLQGYAERQIEPVQLVQNYELIQDLEVIEHLDELL